MSLTQYLEFQEDQNMTRQLYFTRTQKRRREGVFCVLEWRRGSLYSCSEKNMNGRLFNEGSQRIKMNHEPKPYFRLWEKLVH